MYLCAIGGNRHCCGADWTTTPWRQSIRNLIYAHLSGFGNDGDWADLPAYEHLVAAAAGRMLVFQGIVDRPGPIFSALQVGIHASAQSLLSGILAALIQRTAHPEGSGNLIETSLLKGMLPYEQGALIGTQFQERFAQLLAFTGSSEPLRPACTTILFKPATAPGCNLAICSPTFSTTFCW